MTPPHIAAMARSAPTRGDEAVQAPYIPTHNVRANLVQTTRSADESTYAAPHHVILMATKLSRVILMAAKQP